MNNEKNKKVWLKKCEETLRMGGRSEVTIKNYRYAIIRFLNRYDEKTNISKLTIHFVSTTTYLMYISLVSFPCFYYLLL